MGVQRDSLRPGESDFFCDFLDFLYQKTVGGFSRDLLRFCS